MTVEPGVMQIDTITGEFEMLDALPDSLRPVLAVAAAYERAGVYTDVISCDPDERGIGYLAFNPRTCTARKAYLHYLEIFNGH